MRCEEIMTRDVESVLPGDTCQLAARKMREANIGFLPVCDASGEVQGTVTDRDIAVRLVAHGLPAQTNVWEVMTREVVSCLPDDEIAEAARLMGEREITRLVVLDHADRLVGVLSLADLVRVSDEHALVQTLRHVTRREAREALL